MTFLCLRFWPEKGGYGTLLRHARRHLVTFLQTIHSRTYTPWQPNHLCQTKLAYNMQMGHYRNLPNLKIKYFFTLINDFVKISV